LELGIRLGYTTRSHPSLSREIETNGNPSRDSPSVRLLPAPAKTLPGEALPTTHSSKPGDSSGAQQRRTATGSPPLLPVADFRQFPPIPASCFCSPVSNSPCALSYSSFRTVRSQTGMCFPSGDCYWLMSNSGELGYFPATLFPLPVKISFHPTLFRCLELLGVSFLICMNCSSRLGLVNSYVGVELYAYIKLFIFRLLYRFPATLLPPAFVALVARAVGLLGSLRSDLIHMNISFCYLDSFSVSYLFSVCISCFYGGFRPPPATLAMLVGGGGRILEPRML
jgi:hypothetical protein